MVAAITKFDKLISYALIRWIIKVVLMYSRIQQRKTGITYDIAEFLESSLKKEKPNANM